MILRELLNGLGLNEERMRLLAEKNDVSVLDDIVKVELEDQVYLDVKEVYFLPGATTVLHVTGKSLVCDKGYHNLCPNAKSWCTCTCHKDDVEGLTPR